MSIELDFKTYREVASKEIDRLNMQIENLKDDRDRIHRIYQHGLNQALEDSKRLDWIQTQADVVIMGTPLSGNIRMAIDAARKEAQP